MEVGISELYLFGQAFFAILPLQNVCGETDSFPYDGCPHVLTQDFRKTDLTTCMLSWKKRNISRPFDAPSNKL